MKSLAYDDFASDVFQTCKLPLYGFLHPLEEVAPPPGANEPPPPYMPFVRNSEQIVQYNVLIHILSLFVLRNAVCRHHHQLYGMGLCMLFAMEKRFNLVF